MQVLLSQLGKPWQSMNLSQEDSATVAAPADSRRPGLELGPGVKHQMLLLQTVGLFDIIFFWLNFGVAFPNWPKTFTQGRLLAVHGVLA